MEEFWELNFKSKKAMWGFEPTDSAIETAEFFSKGGLQNILIPGFGYGRNATIFFEKGLKVTGIEISETAIKLAQKNYRSNSKIYHGSVTDMPFDKKKYDGIYCYALLHLLNANEREKFIQDCFNQLKPNGYMVFVTISKKDITYAKGEEIGKDRFQTKHGVNLFFYDPYSIKKEFGRNGLVDITEIEEPAKSMVNLNSRKFYKITCKKPSSIFSKEYKRSSTNK